MQQSEFTDFWEGHSRLFSLSDEAGLARAMHEILVKHRVNADEAKAASLLLLESPPRFRTEHVKAFLACVYRGRESSQPRGNGFQRTESSDCKQCFGSGFVTVLHPKPDLWAVDELGYKRWRNPKTLYTCAVRCDCPNGPPSQTLGIIEYERSFPTWREEWDAVNTERIRLGKGKVLRW